MANADSALSGLDDGPRGPLGRWGVRAGIVALLLLVVGAAGGFLGLRTATTDASAAGYRLAVEYPAVSRAGQPAPLHIRVEHPGGFPGKTVQVALCDELVDALDFQNWYPNPSAETSEDDRIVYEFDTPPGDVLEVSLDARVGPGQLGGRDRCTVSVLEQDQPVVSAEFTAWRAP